MFLKFCMTSEWFLSHSKALQTFFKMAANNKAGLSLSQEEKLAEIVREYPVTKAIKACNERLVSMHGKLHKPFDF